MRFNKVLILLSAFMLMAICSYCQEVHYNYDRGINFANYKTYQWVDGPGAPNVTIEDGGPLSGLSNVATQDQLVSQEIRRAVDEQLAQKGLKKVDKDGDLKVSYHAAVRTEKGLNLSGSGWAPERGWAGTGGWWDASVQGHTSTIPIGTLVIDLRESAGKQLVWRGDVSKAIDLNRDPNKNYKTLQKAVTKLFKNYPPQNK